MPVKQEQRAEVNNFTNGLITEASQLVFPPNSLADVENFVINKDGTVSRRPGMAIERDGVVVDTGLSSVSFSPEGSFVYNWKEVAGNSSTEFLVVQAGNKLLFFDAYSAVISEGFVGEILLADAPTNRRFSFSTSEGILVVATGLPAISVIEYDPSSRTLISSELRLLTRDVWGMEDTDKLYEESINYRGAADPIRRYNLQNQSWGKTRKNVAGLNPPWPTTDPLSLFPVGRMPSNAQMVWGGMITRSQASTSSGGLETEGFARSAFDEADGSFPMAAKGYFIIDVLSRGESRKEAVDKNNRDYPGLTVYSTSQFKRDLTEGGPTTVAEFAGRVFYGGFSGGVTDGDSHSPNYSNFIFFSQLAKNKRDLNKCYQDGDPTSRESPDIVDTDGGFLRISEAINIISMLPLGGGLLVLASNGVWMIKGGSDYGFTASNYRVEKLSEFGVLAPKSVVREGNSAYFWSSDSIFLVAKDQFGDYNVNSITLDKIQKFYDSIPTEAKAGAMGTYSSQDKTVRWVYTDIDGTPRELVRDILQGCFFKNTIARVEESNIVIPGPFRLPPRTSRFSDEGVYVLDDEVFAGSDPVVISTATFNDFDRGLMYLFLDSGDNGNIHVGFSEYSDTSFKDFGEMDAFAFLITGTSVAGDSGIDKQIPYITSHFLITEKEADEDGNLIPASGCLMRGQWSFANKVQSHKWSPAQQIYRLVGPRPPVIPGEPWDSGFDIVTTKSKVRGKGPAFALRAETQEGKDCRLVGWNVTLNGNAIS